MNSFVLSGLFGETDRMTTSGTNLHQRNKKSGLLRYSADSVSISVVLLAVVSSLIPFMVTMPTWALLVWFAAVLFIRSFTPYIQHNHGHLGAFHSKSVNHLYDVLLTQVTGYATALWELQHNRGHHRNFLTPELDPARLTHLKSGKLMSRWMYALRGNLTIFRDSVAIGKGEGKAGKKTLISKLYGESAVQLAVTGALFYWNPWMTLFFVVIPNVLTAWFIWWESYAHHLHAPTTGMYDASITIAGESFNRQTFNIGHHTAHHERPTLHWSILPQRTEEILEKIPGFCVRGDRARSSRRQVQEFQAQRSGHFQDHYYPDQFPEQG